MRMSASWLRPVSAIGVSGPPHTRLLRKSGLRAASGKLPSTSHRDHPFAPVCRRARDRQGQALRAALKRAVLDRPCARRPRSCVAGTKEWLRRGRTKECRKRKKEKGKRKKEMRRKKTVPLDKPSPIQGARLVSPVLAQIQPPEIGRRRARQVSPLRHARRSSNAHRSNSMKVGISRSSPASNLVSSSALDMAVSACLTLYFSETAFQMPPQLAQSSGMPSETIWPSALAAGIGEGQESRRAEGGGEVQCRPGRELRGWLRT